MDAAQHGTGRTAGWIASAYAAVATLWILGSGWLLDVQIADPRMRSLFEYGKGLVFVAITAVLLWLMVRRALRRERIIAQEREEAIARLADAERTSAVGVLASGLAHEFNNLHAVADGHLELAQRAGPADARLERRLSGARAALARAAGLSRSLLGLARPGVGQRVPVRLDRLVADTMDLVRRGLEADGVAVELELPEVPPVAGDPCQLGQVVMNLLINADHAMQGCPVRRLQVRTAHVDGHAVIEVADSGHGIAPEHRERLFRPFFTTKVDASGGRPRGTGMGLSVSRSMVLAHGGRISVRSEPGSGAVFIVEIPVAAQLALTG